MIVAFSGWGNCPKESYYPKTRRQLSTQKLHKSLILWGSIRATCYFYGGLARNGLAFPPLEMPPKESKPLGTRRV